MPPGTPYHGLIPPFPIRVDQFGAVPQLDAAPPALHLLSHTHSDHIVGLSAKSFASQIICSADAKEMLLKHEVYGARALVDAELRAEVRVGRTFGHLKVPPVVRDGRVEYAGSRDLLKTLPLNTPTRIELSASQKITLTLIDANHCPGAVMFLVEGPDSAVLHTGDFRAEPWFLDDMRRNPFLQRYLAPMFPAPATPGSAPLFKTLDTIYLDTACMLSDKEVPTKADGTRDLVELMALLPPTTIFFINAWTWGYEEILRAVARAFHSQIHVDRYKHTVFSRLADPFLRSLVTLDASQTRFHACERFNRCSYADAEGVVYINPVTMGKPKWAEYRAQTESRLRAAQPVTVLLVPLSRHSPLPELRAFVSLFRPKRVVPNTLDPALGGYDEICTPRIFVDCLATPPSHAQTLADALVDTDDAVNLDVLNEADAALQNLVGAGAEATARAWADAGRAGEKLAVLEPYLRGGARAAVRRALGMSPLPAADDAGERGVSILQRAQDARRGRVYRMPAGESDSEDEDSDAGDDDAHARVARAIFRIGGGSDPLEASTQEMSQDMAGSEPEPSQELPLVAEEEMSDVVMETSRPRTPIRAPPPEPARMPAPPSPVSPRRPRRKDPSKPTKPEGDPAPAPATDLPRMRSVRFDEPAPRAPKRPREEAPLADMRNRPEADHPHPQSQSQSQSQSSEASEPLPEPLAKRRRVEAWRAEISDALDTDAQARRGVQRAQETAYVAPPLPTPVEEVRRAAPAKNRASASRTSSIKTSDAKIRAEPRPLSRSAALPAYPLPTTIETKRDRRPTEGPAAPPANAGKDSRHSVQARRTREVVSPVPPLPMPIKETRRPVKLENRIPTAMPTGREMGKTEDEDAQARRQARRELRAREKVMTEKLRAAMLPPTLPRQSHPYLHSYRPVAMTRTNTVRDSSFKSVDASGDEAVNWAASEALAERVRASVAEGHGPAKVLPRLSCLESQSQR